MKAVPCTGLNMSLPSNYGKPPLPACPIVTITQAEAPPNKTSRETIPYSIPAALRLHRAAQRARCAK